MNHSIGERIPDLLQVVVIAVGRKLLKHDADLPRDTRGIPPVNSGECHGGSYLAPRTVDQMNASHLGCVVVRASEDRRAGLRPHPGLVAVRTSENSIRWAQVDRLPVS